MSDILCYKLRKKKNKKVNPPQSSPSPPPYHQVNPKPRYGSEKVANFKAPQPQTSPTGQRSYAMAPPLSPGRVRVHKNLSSTPSTVSSGYQYRVSTSSISPSPTPKSSTARNPNSPNLNQKNPSQIPSKPPSRNSAYSPPSSPVGQNRKQSENSKTYLDQLEEENKQLKKLLLNQNMASSLSCHKHEESEKECYPNKREIWDKNVESDHLQSGEVFEEIKVCSERSQVNGMGTNYVRKYNIEGSVGGKGEIGTPSTALNLCPVPDLIQIIPGQLSPNALTKSQKNQQPKQAIESYPTRSEIISRHKKHNFLFVGSNGEVLAESKGNSEGSEIIYKRINAKLDKTEDGKTPAWQKLKQISSNLEQSLGCHACAEVPRYPCHQEMYFKSDQTKDQQNILNTV
jgi:hypothetical protein